MTTTTPAAASAAPSAPVVARWGGKGVTIAMVVCALLVVAGLALWGVQLAGGMVQTNMRNLDSWGLYILTFMFFVGLSAGGLIISSIPRAFGMEGFGGISKVAVWSSICCTVCAVALVLVDLGNPLRVWELFVYSNLTSPLMWDIIVISTYLILSVVYLWATVRNEQGRFSAAALRVISTVALVCAVLVHSVTAWILGLNVSHEFWHTALLAPWFVSSALVCGTALVLAICIALRKAGYLELDQKYVVKMAKMLGVFVMVDLYFFGCDLLTSGFPGGEGAEVVAMLTTGQLAPFFWTEIVGCALCAVVCFVPKLRRNPLLVVGALLAIVGIFCKRVQLIVGGFQLPNLEYATVLSGLSVTNADGTFAQAFQGIVYTPTPLECGITLAVFALGVLLFLAGLKFLPLKPTAASH
jgi:molybdopterin-containing oxidoreductase family membrane subunit